MAKELCQHDRLSIGHSSVQLRIFIPLIAVDKSMQVNIFKMQPPSGAQREYSHFKKPLSMYKGIVVQRIILRHF